MTEDMFGDFAPDRITEMLRPQNPLLSIGQAAAASIGGGNFGQNLGQIQGRETSKALALMQLLGQARREKMAERSAALQERRMNLSELTAALREKRADERHQQAMTRLSQVGGGGGGGTQTERFLSQLSPEERAKAMRIQLGLEPRAASGQGFEVTTAAGDVIRMGAPGAAREMLERDKDAAAVLNVLDLGGKIVKQGQGDPLLGFTGSATRLIEGGMQQARALAGAFMSPEQMTGVLNPEGYGFGRLSVEANKSAAVKSNIVSLAFMIALARNGGRGPITKADVQNAIEEMGADAGSVGQLNAGLEQVIGNTIRQYEIRNPTGARSKLYERAKSLGIQTPEEMFPKQPVPSAPRQALPLPPRDWQKNLVPGQVYRMKDGTLAVYKGKRGADHVFEPAGQ